MRALKLQSAKEAVVVDMDEPVAGRKDVLVRVSCCGICGTDLHIYNGEFPVEFPLVQGHEFSGVVERVGRAVRGLRVGDHVAVDPNISCGTCYYCRKGMTSFCQRWEAAGVTRQGAFAELVAVPFGNAYRVPERVPLERFAFVEPVSCILHGMDRVKPKRGESALVTGLGAIGLIFGQLLKRNGVRVMGTDMILDRLKMAKKVGFDRAVNPSQESVSDAARSWTGDKGVDLVVEASGSVKAMTDAVRLLDRGGRILIFGVAPEGATLEVRPFDIYRNELSIIGSFTNPLTFKRAVDILSLNKISVDDLVSEVVSLDGVVSAFEDVAQRKGIKYLVRPG